MVLFENFYNNVEWWKESTANNTIIPIGICGDKNYCITFDEEYKGDFPSSYAIIIGMSGAGKSSLLDTMIVGSCIKYSPNELRLILIDQHCEFRQYAEEKLPHAEIVANCTPSEVVLHILQVICKMIRERSDLFRDKEVNNFYSYRKKYPTDVLPRYMVVIDEYLNILNDGTERKREALYCLDYIIRVGRALGFNLVLSSLTMELPADMLCDTWGREPYRIVMRTNFSNAKPLLGCYDERLVELKVGQAIVCKEKRELVQSYYIPKSSNDKPTNAKKTRLDYLRMIRNRWNEDTQGKYKHNFVVFDADEWSEPIIIKPYEFINNKL